MAHSEQAFQAHAVLKIVFFVLMSLAVLVCADHTRRWFSDLPPDLRAFYAGGQVINDFASPYTVQPLLRKEQSLAASPREQNFVAPVPLPPYDLALLSLLARLPVKIGTALMALLTLGAGCITGYMLYRVSTLPLSLSIAAAFMATVYDASGLGQIAPIAIAAIATAVWAVRVEKFPIAAVALSLAMIQPQIAIGPCIALFAFVPRARFSMLVCALFALSLSVVALDPGVISGYVQALGMHARAELHFPAQLSLTWFAAYLGVSPELALLLGSLSTAVMLVFGLVLIARRREAAIANGAVVALPAAFGVIGGSFLHGHQLALTLVPALLLLRPVKSYVDSSWALAVLFVPFMEMITLEPFWPNKSAYPSIAVAFAIAWTVTYVRNTQFGTGFALRKASLITLGLGGVFGMLVSTRPIANFAMPAIHHIAMQNASLEWALFCEAANVGLHSENFIFFAKLPIWLSAITIAVCSARNLETR